MSFTIMRPNYKKRVSNMNLSMVLAELLVVLRLGVSKFISIINLIATVKCPEV